MVTCEFIRIRKTTHLGQDDSGQQMVDVDVDVDADAKPDNVQNRVYGDNIKQALTVNSKDTRVGYII